MICWFVNSFPTAIRIIKTDLDVKKSEESMVSAGSEGHLMRNQRKQTNKGNVLGFCISH